VLVLALDTATPAVTVSLLEAAPAGLREVAARTTVDARRHAELLVPSIETVLAEADAAPGDLGAVVAGTGPGPYTGLRVGLATAAALADALGIPSYGVCSLDGVLPEPGAGSPEPGSAEAAQPYLVATDARRREVYWASYDAAGSRTAGPDVGPAAAVPTDGLAFACGAGALLYADVLTAPVRGPQYPSARALAARAADRVSAGAPGETLTPRYLRRPDAVEPVARKPALR